MKFSKMLLLSFLIALIMLILTLGVLFLLGLRYTSVPINDGTSVAFFGWMKNGEMQSGTLYYSGGVTAKYDREAKMLVYSDKGYYMGEMSGILKLGAKCRKEMARRLDLYGRYKGPFARRYGKDDLRKR